MSLYKRVSAKGHPKEKNRRKFMLFEHVIIAERALGRCMPLGAHVHHVNGNKRDNSPGNLVVCENAAYHALLHVRARAYKACGNASWRACIYCKQYDDISAMRPRCQFTMASAEKIEYGVQVRYYHKKCNADYARGTAQKRRLKKQSQGE